MDYLVQAKYKCTGTDVFLLGTAKPPNVVDCQILIEYVATTTFDLVTPAPCCPSTLF